MKRTSWFFGLFLFLATAIPMLADGFIIIHDPLPAPDVLPRPRPIPMPPPRWPPVHAFAPLEVTYHHVQVRINDQIAVTSVDQEFYNPNVRQLEGTYIFPIPSGAQINKFSMEIGGKEVEAELMSADKARRIYEDIVRKLKDPALMEYAGRDVFKVRIFPIEPRANKRVKISYSQVLKADSGLVSYVYPLNTEKFSAKPIKTVSLKLELETRQPLKSIYSPTHAVEIKRRGDNQATLGFESKDVKPDTDFQVFYGVEKGDFGANVMTYRTSGEDGYFLMLASPGFDQKGKKVIPKDLAFVLDTSGSMARSKLAQAKKALLFCLENLNENDRFDVIRFSTESEPLFNKLADASEENRRRAREFVNDLKAIGGTAIDDALTKALECRPKQSDRPYIIIFLTDGQPTVGNTVEDQIVAHVTGRQPSQGKGEGRDRQAGAGENTRIFCFGIGQDVNTHLLDKITEATKAFSQYVLAEEDIEVKVSNFFTKIKEPVLTNVKLTFPEGVHATKMYPSPLPDLFKGEQLVVAGRYSGNSSGKTTLSGRANSEARDFTFKSDFPERSREYEFIPRLWATRRIGYLLDEIRLHGEEKELRDEVTELARRYGVVTPYTAYLIMEDETRRDVPVFARSMESMRRAPMVLEQAGVAGRQLREQKDGSQATAMARSSLALKQATAPTDAIFQGNVELDRAQARPAGRSGAGGGAAASRYAMTSPAGAASPSTVTAVQALQQSSFAGGRSFYQNGNQWIDAGIQKMPNAKRIRIQFNSQEYFDLAAKEPQILPWLALGQNIQFVQNGAIYEIFEP